LPEWTTAPIPGVSLSAGGLLALADLQTIAQRTALTGTSTWLDALILAPGLHYQQAADALTRYGDEAQSLISARSPNPSAVEYQPDGSVRVIRINNAATVNFIRKVSQQQWERDRSKTSVVLPVEPSEGAASRAFRGGAGTTALPGGSLEDRMLTLDVGVVPPSRTRRFLPGRRQSKRRSRRYSGARRVVFEHDGHDEWDWLSHLLYLTTPLLTFMAIAFVILLGDCEFRAFSLH
jgi:hypothetical protein